MTITLSDWNRKGLINHHFNVWTHQDCIIRSSHDLPHPWMTRLPILAHRACVRGENHDDDSSSSSSSSEEPGQHNGGVPPSMVVFPTEHDNIGWFRCGPICGYISFHINPIRVRYLQLYIFRSHIIIDLWNITTQSLGVQRFPLAFLMVLWEIPLHLNVGMKECQKLPIAPAGRRVCRMTRGRGVECWDCSRSMLLMGKSGEPPLVENPQYQRQLFAMNLDNH